MSRFGNLEFRDGSEQERAKAPIHQDAAHFLEHAQRSFDRGRFEEALRAYAKVLEFDAQNGEAWTGQIRMLLELGEFREAQVWADSALERFAEDPDLLAAKAVALARQGELDEALAFSDSAIQEGGASPFVWLARGDVLLARGEKRAAFCFEKAVTTAPGNWRVHWLVSRIYCWYRQFARALKWAQQALELDAAQPAAWWQLGRCQAAVGFATPARKSFQHAEELDPECRMNETILLEMSDANLWTRLSARMQRWLGR